MRVQSWKRTVFVALAGAALAGGLAAGAYRLRASADGEPAALRLPAEVRGRPGRLVVVTAETPAARVRWHACGGPDRPDLWCPPDGKTLLLCTPTPGRYELLAWTAAGSEPTEAVACAVLIETPEPPPPPGPADPFLTALQAAWAAESGTDKAHQRDLLVSLYRVAARDTVRQPQLQTAGDLLAALQQAARSLLPADALAKVRAAVAAELRAKLPTDPAAPLDAAARDRCREQLERVAKALEALR
jgi:hypothetical protein